MFNNSVYKVLLVAIFTVALLVASISVGGKHAQAQTTPQTVADLLDGVSIPGLDSLPVSNLQTTDSYKSADITVHGQTATIVIFKPSGVDKNVVAVIPNDFSLGDFVPLPSGTPLDDVTFSDMAFIIAQANISLAKTDAPTPLSAALSHGSDTIKFKTGLNLFGQADFSASDTVKDLLSNVGITNLTLPLNGSLPTNLFSQNPKTAAQNFKNQILDNLDIKLPMPKINVPGISKIANIQHSTLAIKGENKNGARSLDVKIIGELDVSISGSTLVLDYSADVRKSPGKPSEVTISAHQARNDPFDINLVETFSVTDLDFQLKKGDKYIWTLSGNTTFRNKTVNITFVHNPDVDGQFLYVNTRMTLADIAGGSLGLPGLDDVTLENIQVWHNKFVVEAKVRDKNIWATAFKVSGLSKPYVFVQIGKISPSEIIPGAENTPLKDVDFDNLAFLYSPASTAKKASESNLVPGVAGGLRIAGSDVTIKPYKNKMPLDFILSCAI